MFQYLLKPIVFALSLTTLATATNAAVFSVTPSIGYKNHTIKFKDNIIGNESTLKMNHPVFGLGLGLETFGGASISLVGSYSSGKGKTESLAGEIESDYTHVTGAFQLGVKASLFKIHLGYLLYDELTAKGSDSVDGSKLKGPGYQVGLGFNITQTVTLLAQYEIHQFNEVYLNTVGQYEDAKTYYEKVDSQSMSFHISKSF